MQLQNAGGDQALGEDRSRCSNNVISNLSSFSELTLSSRSFLLEAKKMNESRITFYQWTIPAEGYYLFLKGSKARPRLDIRWISWVLCSSVSQSFWPEGGKTC